MYNQLVPNLEVQTYLPRSKTSQAAEVVPHTKVRAKNIKGSSPEGCHSHWSKSKASWNRISTTNQRRKGKKLAKLTTKLHYSKNS